jgi:phosphoribosylglycinamide formyltransferase-1
LHTHQRAIDAGDAAAGCSVHVVTEELDGGEVLGQAEVAIAPDDTAETLAERVLTLEHRLYPRILAQFVTR